MISSFFYSFWGRYNAISCDYSYIIVAACVFQSAHFSLGRSWCLAYLCRLCCWHRYFDMHIHTLSFYRIHVCIRAHALRTRAHVQAHYNCTLTKHCTRTHCAHSSTLLHTHNAPHLYNHTSTRLHAHKARARALIQAQAHTNHTSTRTHSVAD